MDEPEVAQGQGQAGEVGQCPRWFAYVKLEVPDRWVKQGLGPVQLNGLLSYGTHLAL